MLFLILLVLQSFPNRLPLMFTRFPRAIEAVAGTEHPGQLPLIRDDQTRLSHYSDRDTAVSNRME